jgi:uncharacterized protein YndB with AHSA1/START domain
MVRETPVMWHLKNTKDTMNKKVEKTISINAFPSQVWEYLTDPCLMKKWMGEPEMNIEVNTDWVVGNPILIKGFHHIKFENKGTVLQFDPHKIVQYSHLSSISRLPDTTENYTIITFRLTPNESQTLLTIKIENFPTESIYKHLDFYWHGTTALIKKQIEC